MGQQRVADCQVFEPAAERVQLRFAHRRAANVLAGHGRQHRRRALHRRALQVVLHGADAAQLFATAGPPRPAVLQLRQRRAMAGGFGSGFAVEDQQTAVPGRGDRDRPGSDLRVARDERANEAAPSARGQCQGFG
jgi:hypothetical protein